MSLPAVTNTFQANAVTSVNASVSLTTVTNTIGHSVVSTANVSITGTTTSVNSLVAGVSSSCSVSAQIPSVSSTTIQQTVNTSANTVLSNIGSSITANTPVANATGGSNVFLTIPSVSSGTIQQTAVGVQNMEGLVVDGYLSGATVSRVNGSQSATVTTNSSGFFTGLDGNGSIQATGGTDVSSGAAFNGIFTAPDVGNNYAVVTPLTTLIDKLHAGGHVSTIGQSSSVIKGALGLPDVDLLNMNPITGAVHGSTNASSADTLAVFKAGLMVSRTLQLASGGN